MIKSSNSESRLYKNHINELENELKNPELSDDEVPQLQERLADIADIYQDNEALGSERYKIYELQALIFFYQKNDEESLRFLDLAQDMYGSQYEYAEDLRAQILSDGSSKSLVGEHTSDQQEMEIPVWPMFNGRLSILQYLGGVICAHVPLLGVIIVFTIVNFAITYMITTDTSTQVPMGLYDLNQVLNNVLVILGMLCYLLVIILSFGMGVRRLHDIGKSGWYILLFFIPVANLYIALLMLLVPGQKKVNEYGKPNQPHSAKTILLGGN